MLVDYHMERQSPDKKLFVSANTNVPLHKRHIVLSVSGNTEVTCTMPNVSEAEGRRFVFSAATIGAATNDRAVVNYSDGGASSLTTGINTTGVEVSFESDGLNWHVLRGE